MVESVRVICRIRPPNLGELSRKSGFCLTSVTGTSLVLGVGQAFLLGIFWKGRVYTYDAVLDRVSQSAAYETIGKPIIDYILNGYNGTIFVYGQTASGKTYTMEGEFHSLELLGVIPRILADIIRRVQNLAPKVNTRLKVSYMELYMEKLYDLLETSNESLCICEDQKKRTFVKGLTERSIGCFEDVMDILEEGRINKHTSATSMNKRSSRSHSIFTLTLEQTQVESSETTRSQLCLVDLAGSEKVSKTLAVGSTLDEAKGINRSLSNLGNVINALVTKSRHVPYRNSKLTRILQQSLGGNAKTTVVICVSPTEPNLAETRSTLLFGVRAKRLRNRPACNTESGGNYWKHQYEKEKKVSSHLRASIHKMETELDRWRRGERVPKSDWSADSTLIGNANESSFRSCFDPRKEDEIQILKNEKSKLISLVRTFQENEKVLKETISAKETSFKNELEIKNRQIRSLSGAMEDLVLKLEADSKRMVALTKELSSCKQLLDKFKSIIQVNVSNSRYAVSRPPNDPKKSGTTEMSEAQTSCNMDGDRQIECLQKLVAALSNRGSPTSQRTVKKDGDGNIANRNATTEAGSIYGVITKKWRMEEELTKSAEIQR